MNIDWKTIRTKPFRMQQNEATVTIKCGDLATLVAWASLWDKEMPRDDKIACGRALSDVIDSGVDGEEMRQAIAVKIREVKVFLAKKAGEPAQNN